MKVRLMFVCVLLMVGVGVVSAHGGGEIELERSRIVVRDGSREIGFEGIGYGHAMFFEVPVIANGEVRVNFVDITGIAKDNEKVPPIDSMLESSSPVYFMYNIDIYISYTDDQGRERRREFNVGESREPVMMYVIGFERPDLKLLAQGATDELGLAKGEYGWRTVDDISSKATLDGDSPIWINRIEEIDGKVLNEFSVAAYEIRKWPLDDIVIIADG